ncbi:MAG: AIM24 family protein [Pseudomonadota bacterium]
MTFQSIADTVHEHTASDEDPADLSFVVSGRFMQQLAVTLRPGRRMVGWAKSVIAHDNGVILEDAGNEALVMACNVGDADARVVLSPGGCVGVFDLKQLAGRILLPQENFLAVGPGVQLRPYSHIKSLKSANRPDGLVLLQADGEGWVFLAATGEVSHLKLGAGEILAARGSAIAALGATVVIEKASESHGVAADNKLNVAILRGPGNVWLQSAPAPANAPDPDAKPGSPIVVSFS